MRRHHTLFHLVMIDYGLDQTFGLTTPLISVVNRVFEFHNNGLTYYEETAAMGKTIDFSDFKNIAIPTSTGNYVPYCITGDLIYLAGQTCSRDDKMLYCGRVGIDLPVAQAILAARTCMENLLAALYRAVDGDFSRVIQCVKVNGYVNSLAPFGDGPSVINGASDLVVALMGEAGKHARTSVGVSALPGNAAVEVEAIFRIKPGPSSHMASSKT